MLLAKYSDWLDQYIFCLVAVEMLGPFNEMAYELVGILTGWTSTSSVWSQWRC